LKSTKASLDSDWLFLWLRFSKDETKMMFYYFVTSITKMLIGKFLRCRLLFVMKITHQPSENQETIMKLINKVIALFSNMNVSFGTINH